MTARVGDALSHVYFRLSPGPIFQRFLAANQWSRFGRPRRSAVRRDACKNIGSARICMGPMSHPGGSNLAIPLLLAADFVGAREDCIRQQLKVFVWLIIR